MSLIPNSVHTHLTAELAVVSHQSKDCYTITLYPGGIQMNPFSSFQDCITQLEALSFYYVSRTSRTATFTRDGVGAISYVEKGFIGGQGEAK